MRIDNENTNQFNGFAAQFRQPFAKEINNISSEAEKIGYSFGYLMGRSNADTLKDLDLDAFSQGLKTAAAGQQSSLSDEEMTQVLTQYKRQSDAKELIVLKQKAEENARAGKAFLQENAKSPALKPQIWSAIPGAERR